MVDMLTPETHGFYIEFELRPSEDREATIKAGHPVFKDVEFAVITMPGGGLVVDKVVDDALLDEWQRGSGRKPPSPFAVRAYEAWKQDLEIPVNGTDLKNWPGVTPAQLKTCQMATVRTIEDLANCNADTLRKLGMGGVALKNKAEAYLASAEGNKGSEEIAAMKIEVEALKEAVKAKDEQIDKLMDQLTDPAPKKRGRPPKGD